jgi:hypothetical protein
VARTLTIEHRLFCHITQNWRGKPLMDRVATCGMGIKVTKAEMANPAITGNAFRPE